MAPGQRPDSSQHHRTCVLYLAAGDLFRCERLPPDLGILAHRCGLFRTRGLDGADPWPRKWSADPARGRRTFSGRRRTRRRGPGATLLRALRPVRCVDRGCHHRRLRHDIHGRPEWTDAARDGARRSGAAGPRSHSRLADFGLCGLDEETDCRAAGRQSYRSGETWVAPRTVEADPCEQRRRGVPVHHGRSGFHRQKPRCRAGRSGVPRARGRCRTRGCRCSGTGSGSCISSADRCRRTPPRPCS